MGTFQLQLERFAAKTRAQASDFVGLVVIKMHERIDLRSPVGDGSYWKSPAPKGYTGGRFRANNQIGVNFRPSGETGRIDKTGESSRSAVIAALPGDGQNAGPVYWIVNNVPYGGAIEDGHSRQAPQGVYGLTAVEFQSIVAEAATASKQ